jgi:hypothetical protein
VKLRPQPLSKRASRRPELEAHLVAGRADVPEELILSESLTKMTCAVLCGPQKNVGLGFSNTYEERCKGDRS